MTAKIKEKAATENGMKTQLCRAGRPAPVTQTPSPLLVFVLLKSVKLWKPLRALPVPSTSY